MTDLLEQQQAQVDVARAVWDDLTAVNWVGVARFLFVEAGSEGFTSIDCRDATGRLVRLPMRMGYEDAVERLHKVMADPAKGSWLSAELLLHRDGKYTFTFDYDRRVHHNADPFVPPHEPPYSPTDDAWREEFRRFPRSPEFLPDWARALTADGATADRDNTTTALWERATTATVNPPTELTLLVTQPRWADLWRQITDTTVERLHDDFNKEHVLDYLDLDRSYEGFWQEVYGAVARPLFGGLEASGEAASRLASELVAAGLLDVSASEEAREKVVRETIIELVEHQIKTRLGIE